MVVFSNKKNKKPVGKLVNLVQGSLNLTMQNHQI